LYSSVRFNVVICLLEQLQPEAQPRTMLQQRTYRIKRWSTWRWASRTLVLRLEAIEHRGLPLQLLRCVQWRQERRCDTSI
jgi:hypothetical protein